MLKKWVLAVVILLNMLLLTPCAQALDARQVPEPLKPWVDWALHGENTAGCPFFYSDADTRRCAWGSALELRLSESGGGFAQRWQMQRADWVPLPGDSRHWPQEVSLDGKPAAVADRDGRPMLRLDPGEHAVSGAFVWDKLPEALQLAPDVGIVALSLRGQAVPTPFVDEQGRLWLQRRAAAATAEDHLELRVHRLLDDDIPLQLTTRLQLSVSGKARDLLLAPALLPGFVPLALQSPLPARLEADGRLRVQARPGTWEITLAARHDGSLQQLALPADKAGAGESRAAEEVWVFAAHNQLRLVNIEGAPALDPQQTTLPEEWKVYPAYRMQPGSVLALAEKKRGDPDPAPDQLHLQRTLWLDFDGGGYTLQDRINGSINRGWRLDMAPPAALGRVALLGADGQNGRDQLVTQGSNGAAGVELRQGQVNLVAESRLPRAGTGMAAVGWLQDFHSVAAELRLPPGWKLFAAAGVDQAPGSWLRSWNLLDIFLVLVVALAVARLWGRNWGLLALLAMALIYPETGAPRWVWLNLLAAAALLRYLPAGMALKLASAYRMLALIGLVLIALPFAVQQIRIGLFPALEKPWGGAVPVARQAAYQPASLPAVAPEAAVMEEQAAVDSASAEVEMKAKVAGLSASLRAGAAAPEPAKKAPLNLAEHDPGARIQTGPGLPEWGWNSYTLQWNGPLRHDQTLQLWLLSPAMNLVLAFLRVALLMLLAWRVLDLPAVWRPSFRPQAAMLALAALLLGGIPAERAWAELPTPEMLKELKQRLTEAPACLPQCASSPRLALEVKGDTLRLRQEIHALADVAVPLPGGGQHWLPRRVLVDGAPHAGLLRQGDALWLHLAKGSHQVVLEGALPERDSVEIPLPLRPQRVDAAVDGWTLTGVHEDGLADDNLHLKRARQPSGPASALQAETLPPFVRITRTLHLGLEWQVETRVTRLSPPGSAVVLEVPLLPGEAVVSDWLRSKDGRAQLSMAPTVDEVVWTSTLREAPQLALTAASQNQWAETWQVDVSPIWHVEFAGIPPVGHQDTSGKRLPTFRPWPGEQLKITVSRPQAVAGQTLTIDGSQLTLKPGLRDTDASLELRVRSSQGGQHVVTLPAGAELLDVAIDGQTQPIRAQNGKVVLPVMPGAQSFKLSFREPHGMGWHAATPVLDVGADSVNARITLQPPQDRWTLFLGGPRLGPAVLFWGVLLVLAALSWGLGKVPLTSLKMHEWLLLGLGLTQTPPEIALVIVGWLLALGWRGRDGAGWGNNRFNFTQIMLALWTLAAFSALFYAIQHGLLGLPEMQIEGNGSSAYQLNWFQDRSAAVLPEAWVISLPLFVYRLLMLAWALWLAAALLRWLRWGWGCYMADGLWRKLVLSKKRPAPAESEQK